MYPPRNRIWWIRFTPCLLYTSKNRFGVSAFGLMDVLNSTNNCATVVYDSTDKKYYNGFTHEPEAKRNLEVLEFIQTLAKDGSLMGEWVQGAEARCV